MEPEKIIACLSRRGIAFDSPVTTEQILGHTKTHKDNREILHLLASLMRAVIVLNRCSEPSLRAIQPYP